MIDYMMSLQLLLFISVGYLLGSVPFGIIAGRMFGQLDVRQHGSGKIGMTNVMRTVGKPAAILVLLLDMGKAIVTVIIARIFSDTASVQAAAGLAALVGHIWPIFAGFHGGRGTAPGWGVLLILSPLSGLIATVLGLITVALFRYVSLGSLIGSSTGALSIVILSAVGIEPTGYIWYGAIGGPLIILLHRSNISRLLKGQERKIGQSDD